MCFDKNYTVSEFPLKHNVFSHFLVVQFSMIKCLPKVGFPIILHHFSIVNTFFKLF